MAGNKGLIDEIVAPESYDQIEKTIKLIRNLQGEFVGVTSSVRNFNDEISKAKTVKEYEASTAKAAAAMNDMAAKANKLELSVINLEQKKQKIAEDAAKRLVKEAADEAKKTKTVVSNSAAEVEAYKRSATGAGKLGDVVTDLAKKEAAAANASTAAGKSQKEYTNATEEATNATTEEAEALSDVDRVLKDVSGTLEQNIRQQIKLKLESSANSAAQKQLKKDFEAGVITEQKYLSASIALEREQVRLKSAIQQNSTVIRQQAKLVDTAAGSDDNLRAKLDRLRTAYTGLTEAEKNNVAIGGVLKKEIDELAPLVDKNSQSIGKYTDQIGNYFKNAAGPLAPAIDAVQGFGGALVALPVAAVAAGLYGLYKAFMLNDDAANKIEGTLLGLKIAVSNAANEVVIFTSALAESETAGVAIEVIKQGFISSIPGVRLLKDAYDALYKAQEDVIQAGIDFTVGMDSLEEKTKISNVTIAKNELSIQRLATASRDATKSFTERLEALDKQSVIEASTTKIRLELINDEIRLQQKVFAANKAGSTGREAAYFRIKELQAEGYKALQDQEALETTNQKRRSTFIKQNLAEEKAKIDSLYALEKQRLEFQRDSFKAVEKDETASLQSRIAATGKAYDKEQELLTLALKHDLSEIDISNNEKIRLNEKYKKDSETLEHERVSTINKIALDSYKQAESDYDKYLSRQQKAKIQAQKDELLQIEINRDNELSAVIGNDQAAVDKRLDINRKYTLEYIKLQIKQAEAAIAAADSVGIHTKQQEAELAALKRKYAEANTANAVKSAKTQQEKTQEVLQASAQVAQAVFGLIQQLSDNVYTGQINQINEAQAATDKRYDKEKAAIENSTLTEEEKAVKLAILEKKKAAQDEELARRKKAADVEKAKRDRAIQIGQIIAQTALSVISQLSIPGAGFGLAAAAAAVGAIQLATVLATPLPSYEHGGVKQGDGPAVVSEKGREMVIERDGTAWLTPDTESIIHLNDGARVVTHPATERYLANQTLSSEIRDRDIDINKLIASENYNTDKIVKAVKGSKDPIVKSRGNVHIYKTSA